MKVAVCLSMWLAILCPLLSLRVSAGGAQPMPARIECLVYVGTAIYTGQPSKNIYAFRLDASTGKITALGVVAATVNPGTLAIDPSGRFLYSTSEVGDYKGSKGGGVSAWAIDRATGKLTFLNDEFSGGANPAYIVVDKTGKNVVVANYFGGKVVVFPIHSDGRLGAATSSGHRDGSSVNKQRQEGPHPHSVYVSPDNRFVIVCDLGLDKVLVYRFDAHKGLITPNDPPFASANPGSGPRHLAFSPNSKFVYTVNELQSSVTAFAYDASAGKLHLLQTVSTLPADFKGDNTGAEIEMSSSGRFLYTSNRGHNSIAVFAVDSETGALTAVEHVSTTGKTPRNFAIDPTGKYMFVANEDSNNIVIFRIDAQTGRLTPTGQILKARAPTCVRFVSME
jgi:6-phosphogluconolactonase